MCLSCFIPFPSVVSTSLQIDVLQAEVAALKTLVLSTSPTSPCKELPSGSKVPFRKGHVRNKSTSSAMLGSQQELSVPQPIVRDCKEARDLFEFCCAQTKKTCGHLTTNAICHRCPAETS